MARFGDGFFDGVAKRSVSGGVVEHVEIRRRGEEGLVEIVGEGFVVVVFDYNPFGGTGQWVKLELEDAVGGTGRGHGSNSVRWSSGKEKSGN